MSLCENIPLPDNRPWTAKEAAAFLGFSPRYVYQLARDGVLPAKKRGRKWFFSPSALRDWVGME